jgi:hypothetical protein
MKREIGFAGGSSICGLGSTADVQLFFDCVVTYAISSDSNKRWELITDRLYCRYIKREDNAEALDLMEGIETIFGSLSSNAIDWSQQRANGGADSKLDPSLKTLAQIFERYFVQFRHCVESSELFFKTFENTPKFREQPVMTIISTIPHAILETRRDLSEYDLLSGRPFWKN